MKVDQAGWKFGARRNISLCAWLANQSRVCTCSPLFHQLRLGNCPQQWQLTRHPRHTRQLPYSASMAERGGLTSDGSKLRKSDFVHSVIARHRPVRAPNVNAHRDIAVRAVLSARTWAERLLCVQSRCDNQILISQKWSWEGGMRTCQCGVCTFHTGDLGAPVLPFSRQTDAKNPAGCIRGWGKYKDKCARWWCRSQFHNSAAPTRTSTVSDWGN